MPEKRSLQSRNFSLPVSADMIEQILDSFRTTKVFIYLRGKLWSVNNIINTLQNVM